MFRFPSQNTYCSFVYSHNSAPKIEHHTINGNEISYSKHFLKQTCGKESTEVTQNKG